MDTSHMAPKRFFIMLVNFFLMLVLFTQKHKRMLYYYPSLPGFHKHTVCSLVSNLYELCLKGNNKKTSLNASQQQSPLDSEVISHKLLIPWFKCTLLVYLRLTSQPFFITANTKKFQVHINNCNRTEWSPVRSVIIRVTLFCGSNCRGLWSFFTSSPVNNIRCHVSTAGEPEFDQRIKFPYKAGMSRKGSLPSAKLLWQTKTWSNFEHATE